MKEGLIIGAMLGVIAGALLYKHSDDTKDLVNKGEQMLKKEIKKMSK